MTIEEEIDFCLRIGKGINWTDEMVIDRVLLNRFILHNVQDILLDRVYTQYPDGYSEKFVMVGWYNPYMRNDCNYEDYDLNFIFEKWEIEQQEQYVGGLGNSYKRKLLLLADGFRHTGPWHTLSGNCRSIKEVDKLTTIE